MLWSPFIVSTGLEVPSDVSGVPPGPRCLVPVSSNHLRYSGYSGQLLPPCNVHSWGKYSGVWVGSPALVRGKPCYGAQAWSLPHHHAYSFCGLVGMAEGRAWLKAPDNSSRRLGCWTPPLRRSLSGGRGHETQRCLQSVLYPGGPFTYLFPRPPCSPS